MHTSGRLRILRQRTYFDSFLIQRALQSYDLFTHISCTSNGARQAVTFRLQISYFHFQQAYIFDALIILGLTCAENICLSSIEEMLMHLLTLI